MCIESDRAPTLLTTSFHVKLVTSTHPFASSQSVRTPSYSVTFWPVLFSLYMTTKCRLDTLTRWLDMCSVHELTLNTVQVGKCWIVGTS